MSTIDQAKATLAEAKKRYSALPEWERAWYEARENEKVSKQSADKKHDRRKKTGSSAS